MGYSIDEIWNYFVTSNNISNNKIPLKTKVNKSSTNPDKVPYCPKKLDLHGLTEEAAYSALEKYFAMAQRARHKTVIVITGKGYSNPVNGEFSKGVLRRKFSSWVQYSELSRFVKSFKQAEKNNGGDGAFVVILV